MRSSPIPSLLNHPYSHLPYLLYGYITSKLTKHGQGRPSSSAQLKTNEKAKETRTVEIPMFFTYQIWSRKLFAVARQVFTPQDVEGTFPSSSVHRKMLSPQGVEGAFPSTSTK